MGCKFHFPHESPLAGVLPPDFLHSKQIFHKILLYKMEIKLETCFFSILSVQIFLTTVQASAPVTAPSGVKSSKMAKKIFIVIYSMYG